MAATFTYRDRTIATISRLAGVATLAGLASVVLALAGVADFSVVLSSVLTVFCAVAAAAYHRGTPVRLVVGPDGIEKHQALGMGWQVSWPDVERLVHVPVEPPILAVVSPSLPARRGPTEWPIRNAGLPVNTHGVPATPEILDAMAGFSGRDLS